MLHTTQYHRCSRYTCGYDHNIRRQPGVLQRIITAIFGRSWTWTSSSTLTRNAIATSSS